VVLDQLFGVGITIIFKIGDRLYHAYSYLNRFEEEEGEIVSFDDDDDYFCEDDYSEEGYFF